MNRREFSAGAACVLGAAALGLPGVVFGQARKPDDGVEYQTLPKLVQVEAPAGKIEVIEFFWYACPHCNAFEPKLDAWIRKQPADVFVKRVPVAFRDSFVPQQRLFYTLEAMGKLDALHFKVFNAIHGVPGAQVERSALNREDEIAEWAGKQGVDRAKFTEMYNSFGVQSKARRAAQLQQAFGVSGVPSLGIAGRYYTDGDLARNMDRALQVTDYLIAEARKAK
jgi:thiol:disulfide interchange protein DsbA